MFGLDFVADCIIQQSANSYKPLNYKYIVFKLPIMSFNEVSFEFLLMMTLCASSFLESIVLLWNILFCVRLAMPLCENFPLMHLSANKNVLFF